MNPYIELPIDQIKMDKDNPRITNYLEIYETNNITDEHYKLLLGTKSSSCESLRESIRENGGIVHPIIVNKEIDGTYRVIEGNTRLQIYRDFRDAKVPGNWDKIRAIVYENLEGNKIHSIRLQAHLVGPRDWDSYSKAKYLNYLYNVEHMPMHTLVSFCGGSSKASEIKDMINAYNDMETYYRPMCDDDMQFDIKRFQGFVELQRKTVIDAITGHGYTKTDFAKWIKKENLRTLQDVRRIPDILSSKKATEVFLTENSEEAKKILAVEEITSEKLQDVPYEVLAKELSKKIVSMSIYELCKLRDDPAYSDKLESLKDVCDHIRSLIIEEIERKENINE